MLKKSCPECGSLIELNETGYSPGTTVKAQCQLCGTEVEFSIQASESQHPQNETEFESVETVGETPIRSVGMPDGVAGKQFSADFSSSITTAQILSEDNTDEETEWQPHKYRRLSYWWLAAIPGCIIVILFFTLRKTSDFSHEKGISSVNDTVISVLEEALIEEIPENKSSDDVYRYDGEYLIFGLVGRAQFSYRKIDDAKIIDGPFRFEEGFYEEDGTFTFNGMGIVTGTFKDGLQDGNWEISLYKSQLELTFKDGFLIGPVRWASSLGTETFIIEGTINNRNFTGDYSYRFIESFHDNDIKSIKGCFNSDGIPIGQWNEKTQDGDRYYYIMDEKTYNETGVKGRFNGVYSDSIKLDLSSYMPQLNSFIISDKAKLENQAKSYKTYWEK